MFKSKGIIEINKGIRVNCDMDILFYYRKLFNYYTYNTVKSNVPAYKAHISIVLPDIHKNVVDYSPVKDYDGKIVDFTYDPTDITITKKNIWMKAKLPVGDEIKEILKVEEKDFWGYHLVIGNWKNI